MKRIVGITVMALLSTSAFAASAQNSHSPASSHVAAPSTVPGTGPGSASFNRYVQSHSGLAQYNSQVPNTGPGSSSFNSYVQSHSGLAQYNSPAPTQPTMPLH